MSAAGSPLVLLEGVSKTYDGRTVLAPADLVVPRGQTTVLLGPSGSVVHVDPRMSSEFEIFGRSEELFFLRHALWFRLGCC